MVTCVVHRTNYHQSELLKTRFLCYPFFVAILQKRAAGMRYSATVKVVSEAMDATREIGAGN